ncbi:hypothetical protein [Methylophaga nitratireducenticrescens]|uniref:hypothetical protein n=1 Tax=Methylophaga nitratireducenticrescens TaxID=754476 RepID=UPI000CDC8DAD|nr:hypothetical protein [Methylophaga nitratireducenticrescens]AUZ85803.1 hypothetical protein CDW43_15070 [Methylophaga nitratireducenticrescens]AUZ85871.1 hypothetical protein CDW43_15425 [Methylophaga nitratireducenticrescens]
MKIDCKIIFNQKGSYTKLVTGSPLTNHNYLKRVLETISLLPTVNTSLNVPQMVPNSGQKQSKTAQTIAFLKQYPSPDGIEDWFTRAVCNAVAELMIIGLEGVPAADTMPLVVERFIHALWPKRDWKEAHPYTGAKRLYRSIIETAESGQRWPLPKDILASIPKVKM